VIYYRQSECFCQPLIFIIS